MLRGAVPRALLLLGAVLLVCTPEDALATGRQPRSATRKISEERLRGSMCDDVDSDDQSFDPHKCLSAKDHKAHTADGERPLRSA